MSVNAVQSLLRDYHIAITGFPTEQAVETDQVDFDEAGLQLLKNLEAPIEFQGKSSQSSFDHCKTTFSLQINQSQLAKTTRFRSAQERLNTSSPAHERKAGPFSMHYRFHSQCTIVSITIERDQKIRVQQRCGGVAPHRRSPLLR